MNYDDWKKEVNKKVYLLTQGAVTMDDLSDWLSMDAFNDGVSPKEAAITALEDDDIAMMYSDVWRD